MFFPSWITCRRRPITSCNSGHVRLKVPAQFPGPSGSIPPRRCGREEIDDDDDDGDR